MLKKIAHYHNILSDKKFIWFPFLFLKPEASQLIDLSLYLKMVPCFGVYMAVGLGLRAFLFHTLTLELFLFYLVYSILGFALWFALVTRPLWNYRARASIATKDGN